MRLYGVLADQVLATVTTPDSVGVQPDGKPVARKQFGERVVCAVYVVEHGRAILVTVFVED
jgi:hypothetical protein